MLKASRFLLIFVCILVCSITLPYYYWIALEEPETPPFVTYSSIAHKIIIGQTTSEGYIYKDAANTRFTREEVDSLTPLSNYTQLAARAKMPAMIDGQPISLEEVRLNRLFLRYRPYQLNNPSIGLYPLFESNPPRINLEMPDQFFRITDRMEFITSSVNETEAQLTSAFTEALIKLQFQFPAKLIFGNPTTRKPFDEGYFVTDQKDGFYHIKQVDGKPVCNKIELAENLKIKHMIVYEHNLREFYGLIISGNNRIFLLMTDNYRFQPLPIDNFDPESQQIYLRGNLFYRIFNLISSDHEYTLVTDRQYKNVAEHEITWQTNKDSWYGSVSEYLFPFSIKLTSINSYRIGFFIDGYHWYSIYLGIILTGLLYLFQGLGKKGFRPWYNFLFTLAFGLVGLIAISVFKDFD